MPFLYIPGRKFRQVPHNKLAVCCDEAKGRNRLARMPVVFITAGIRTGPRDLYTGKNCSSPGKTSTSTATNMSSRKVAVSAGLPVEGAFGFLSHPTMSAQLRAQTTARTWRPASGNDVVDDLSATCPAMLSTPGLLIPPPLTPAALERRPLDEAPHTPDLRTLSPPRAVTRALSS